MSDLSFSAEIDLTKLNQGGKQIDSELTKIARQAANSGSILDNSFKKAGQSAGALGSDLGSLQRNLLGLASVATLGRLGQQIITIRGEFQQLGIAFETMLGSKEKADKLMQEAVVLAAKTPFTLQDVATNIKQLMAMGIESTKVMETMKALGDVAAGVSVPISRIAINYGQVATQGKLMGRELRDFNMAGIPLLDELAKNLGKAKQEIAGMVEAGQIGFPDVEKAFQTLSGEGGKFYNLMEKQNKSVTGQISNLTDKLQVMFNQIGQSNEGLIYGGISGLSLVISNYQEVLKVLEVLVATYGTYRVALLAVSAAQSASVVTGNIAAWFELAKGIRTAKEAQIAFNLATGLNPYVAAAAAITGIVAALYLFSEKAKTTEEIVKDLNDSVSAIGKQIEIDGAIEKYNELKDKLSLTKDEQIELNKSLSTLSAMFPGAISGTDQYGKAVGMVTEKLVTNNEELKKALKLGAEVSKINSSLQLTEKQKQLDELIKEQNTGKVTPGKNYGIGTGYSVTGQLEKSQYAKNDAEIKTLITDISLLENAISGVEGSLYNLSSVGAEPFIKAHSELFKKVTDYTRAEAFKANSQLIALLGADGGRADEAIKKQAKALSEYARGLKTVREEQNSWKAQLVEAESKLVQLKNANRESNTPNQDIADQEAVIKALQEKLGLKKTEKKAIDELKKAEEQLEKAVISGDQSAITAAVERVAILEKEKKLIQDRIQLELYRAKFSATELSIMDSQAGINSPMSDINPIGTKPIDYVGRTKTVQGIMYEITAIDKTGPTWKKVRAEGAKLKEFEKKQNEEGAKEQEKYDEEKKKRQEETFQQALQFMDNMLTKYGEQLGMTEEEAGLISSLAKGDYFAAAFNMIGVVSKFFKAEKDGMTEYYSNLDTQTKRLIENLDLVNKSLTNIGTGGSFRSFNVLSSELIKLKNDAARLNEQLVINGSGDNRRGSTNQGSTTNGTRTDETNRARTILDLSAQTAELYAEIEELTYKLLDPNLTEEQRTQIKALLSSYNSIIDSINSSVQNITGTTIPDLSNSLVDVFLSGEDAAAKWGETVDGIIKNVIKKQLVAQLLTKPITEAVNTLINDSSDGLTPVEASKFKISMDALYLTTKPIIDLVNGSFKASEIDLASSSNASTPLTGISSQLTEETGSLLVGQTMAIRTDIKINQNIMQNQLELMDESLSYMRSIADNTKSTARNTDRLEAIENGISQLNDTMKKSLL